MSTASLPHTWKYSPIKNSNDRGTQIDLLFDRKDNAITICEIKYTTRPFEITKQYAAQLNNKMDIFNNVTRTEKQLFLALISANGLKKNIYSEMIDALVTLDDLFQKEE